VVFPVNRKGCCHFENVKKFEVIFMWKYILVVCK
jgi:hypothetical protein